MSRMAAAGLRANATAVGNTTPCGGVPMFAIPALPQRLAGFFGVVLKQPAKGSAGAPLQACAQ